MSTARQFKMAHKVAWDAVESVAPQKVKILNYFFDLLMNKRKM
jgi:hypothetical protein